MVRKRHRPGTLGRTAAPSRLNSGSCGRCTGFHRPQITGCGPVLPWWGLGSLGVGRGSPREGTFSSSRQHHY
ncbi:hypothetical protein E2C01_048026 [Portunus trituberculatus]|uniref:Uncharacterized protein n=1 Tax=Portunus trituberculatus TaxID=210409 RepID=A0A5B7GAF4_PORTR|nr:hypothetical protein [Portunus trituberculatus]